MNKGMDKKIIKRGLLPYLFVVLAMLGIFYFANIANKKVEELSYNEFITELNSGNIAKLEITTRGNAYIHEITGQLRGSKDNE